jgi:hypothetical protein
MVAGTVRAGLVVNPDREIESIMQKQITESRKQKQESDKALEVARREGGQLQERLAIAEEGTAELQKQAKSVKKQAESEVQVLKDLERKVRFIILLQRGNPVMDSECRTA